MLPDDIIAVSMLAENYTERSGWVELPIDDLDIDYSHDVRVPFYNNGLWMHFYQAAYLLDESVDGKQLVNTTKQLVCVLAPTNEPPTVQAVQLTLEAALDINGVFPTTIQPL